MELKPVCKQCGQIWRSFATLATYGGIWQHFVGLFSTWQKV